MAQQQLDVCEFQLLLQEDDIKKEVPDIIKLSCFYCGTAEDVDIKDSNKNTSPFICSGCYTIENREKASEDTTTKIEVITSVYICSEPIVEISIVTWGAIQPG